MTRTAILSTPTTLRLRRGQAQQAALDAGTLLQVGAGRVVVREPMGWLGGAVTAPCVTLSEGEGFRLERGGWVQLEALQGDALVLQHAPVPPWQAAAHWLRTLGRALRRPVGQRAA